jgi:hypothetical protein
MGKQTRKIYNDILPPGVTLWKNSILPSKEEELIQELNNNKWIKKHTRFYQTYNRGKYPKIVNEIFYGIGLCGLLKPGVVYIDRYKQHQGENRYYKNIHYNITSVIYTLGEDTCMIFNNDEVEYRVFVPRRSCLELIYDKNYKFKRCVKSSYFIKDDCKVHKTKDYNLILMNLYN